MTSDQRLALSNLALKVVSTKNYSKVGTILEVNNEVVIEILLYMVSHILYSIFFLKDPSLQVKTQTCYIENQVWRFFRGSGWVFHSKIDLRVAPKGVGKYVNLCPSPSVSNPNWLMAFRSTYELRLASYANKSINNKVFLSSYVVFWMEEK